MRAGIRAIKSSAASKKIQLPHLSEALTASGDLRAEARRGREDGRLSEAAAGEALNASAPGIEIARPAAAPRIIVRILP